MDRATEQHGGKLQPTEACQKYSRGWGFHGSPFCFNSCHLVSFWGEIRHITIWLCPVNPQAEKMRDVQLLCSDKVWWKKNVNFGNCWCFRARRICCIIRGQTENKVSYKLINYDSFAILFSNAFVSPVVFAFFCLCVHFKKNIEKEKNTYAGG